MYREKIYPELQKREADAWDALKTKFRSTLWLKAESYPYVPLFDTPPVNLVEANKAKADFRDQSIRCPGTDFYYRNHLLPPGTAVTMYASYDYRGRAFFDGPVTIPTLLEVPEKDRMNVWMSVTPNEMITQRKGVKKAKGRVVVGGLGLGWFLNAVCEKRSVKEVIVVEQSLPLLVWLRPILEAKFPAIAKKVKAWVSTDVYDFMEKDTKDNKDTIYLLDIWPCIDDCDYDKKFLDWECRLPSKQLWGWGRYFQTGLL